MLWNKSKPRGRGGPVAGRGSTRSTGREVRVLVWLARHPVWLVVSGGLTAGVVVAGPVAVATVLGVLVVGGWVWSRAHPVSFDRWAAPRLRSSWRRWTSYRGARWRAVCEDCDLTREQRRTGQVLVPRITRVRSVTPSIDTLTVAMVRGQDLLMWIDRAPTLADALSAQRVAVTRVGGGRLLVVVEREMPFTRVLDAPMIPAGVDEVDLSALDVGDTETGDPFCLGIRGKHLLVVGASGSGKGSLLWGPLRAMGPMIRAGLVRIWCIDLKGGTETERGKDLFYRWATTGEQAVDLLGEFRDSMLGRQEWMRAYNMRRCEITPDTPYELLIIDEMAMLTAYTPDRSKMLAALRLLAEILTQGRAADHSVAGYVQEPTKDVVGIRDLFTTRVCLAVTTASHVDMALGDGARDRGALADEIPLDDQHAGIGFVINSRSRLPVRFRTGWVCDDDIDELVTRCTPLDPAESVDVDPEEPADVVPLHPTTTRKGNRNRKASAS